MDKVGRGSREQEVKEGWMAGLYLSTTHLPHGLIGIVFIVDGCSSFLRD